MKDEKKRGMHVLRGNIGAASGMALALSQAGCGLQAGGFFKFILPPSSFLFDTGLM